MIFRRVYWVVEQLGDRGSEVAGVYTSIPDLLENGLRSVSGATIRVSAFELDKARGALCTWRTDSKHEAAEAFELLVEAGDFTHEEIARLCDALKQNQSG